LPISYSNNSTAFCKWACYHPHMKGWGTRKRRKDHSLTRSAIHNCKYFDTQITFKKWRLASLHKFNNIQGTWVLNSDKLCSPSSYLHHINILPNNSNSTVLCITEPSTMPVYVKGVHSVVFCNPVINLGRNHLMPILIFVNIFLVLLFKPKRKFWYSLKIYVCQSVTLEKGWHICYRATGWNYLLSIPNHIKLSSLLQSLHH
jgi:hypothetical protein